MLARYHTITCCALTSAILCLLGTTSAADDATKILQASGAQGGLVIQLGCNQPDLLTGLHANDRYLVQGLDHDAKTVEAARKQLQSTGLYGKVSARHWIGPALPYGDNLVNLLVVNKGSEVEPSEIERVLAPRGVALVQGTLEVGGLTPSSPADLPGWTMYEKPVPDEIDDWTHYLHNAGNNAVAQDTRVGPPRHMQWKAGPMWSRSHEFASSVQTMVSAGGRLIGIFDEGIIGQPRGVPAFWALIARDAFNGKLLWRLPCDHVNPHALVATDDKVYVTLKSKGPVAILDAATGETLRTCDETGKVNEIALCEDRLILCTQLDGLHVAAADPNDGRLLWKKKARAISANTLVAGEGKVCFCDGSQLVCLSLDSGEELWRSDVKVSKKSYAILYQGAVFLTGGSTRAFSLESGELLWTGPDGNPHARNPPGLFGADGLIWCAWGHVDPRSFVWQHREEIRNGFDPLTGEVRKTVQAERLVTAGHHIRCYPSKATSRYLLLNKRGVEFFDLQGTNHMRANWSRGACGFGMLPANGLLYAPPSQCFCYQGVLLTGFNALAATRETPTKADPTPRLQKGPAYTSLLTAHSSQLKAQNSDWPTYRHDMFRSGSIDTSLPVELDRLWEVSLCPPAFPDGKDESESDAIVLGAADATIHGQGAKRSGDAIIAWRGKDTSVSWATIVDKTGPQPVWLLQANQGPGGSTFEIAIGDQKLTGEIRHTDTWEQPIWVRVGDIDIPEANCYTIAIKPLKQVDGRLGNVSAVALGGEKPPAGAATQSTLRERPAHRLTPPVAADGRIFVAEPDAHTVYALSADNGQRLWQFVADGRVDSPPTIHEGLCLFGSTDGHVYCLTAAEGRLVWRFRAAPEDRQIFAMDQLESVWPVHGSVLVRDGKVYCTAGRSSHLDGGIYVYALDPNSGEIVHQTRINSDEPDVEKYGGRPFDMEGARSDILVAGKEDIYLYQNRLKPDLTWEPMPQITKLGDRKGEAHIMTTDGFLDPTWFNRTYWTYGERWPGYYFTYRGPKAGQILVFDEANTYALKVYTERVGHSPEFRPGSGYDLVADRNTTKPVLDEMDIGAEKGRGFTRTELPIWSTKTPIRVHGMLVAQDRLYLAGTPDLLPGWTAHEAMIGKRGATFRVVSTSDGTTLSEFSMKEAPVFDGLIAAGDRLFMATMDGTLVCLGGKK